MIDHVDRISTNVHHLTDPNGHVCEICGEAFSASDSRQRTCGRVCGRKLIYPFQCQLADCAERYYASGYCRRHYRAWWKYGDPQHVGKPGGSRGVGPDNPRWQGDQTSYQAIHVRLTRKRGAAKQHACHECGDQAAEWAYDHKDPNERVGLEGHGAELIYSTNLDHYLPMCVRCHRLFDLAHNGRLRCG